MIPVARAGGPAQQSELDAVGEAPEETAAARQNPILRSYYRTRFTQAKAFGEKGFPRPDPFLEEYVDRQIDHLLGELEKKLTLTKAHLASALKGREAYLEAISPGQKEQARRHWKQALVGVSDNAGDLWNLLRYIFTGLEEKDGNVPQLSGQDQDESYQRQHRYLEQEIGMAERRIQRYFFQADSTVHLEDVRGKNMLIHLYRVREMANRLKRSL